MGQKCEWCRLEMGSGWHLIRYFYEKQQIIIILLRWVYALPSSSSPLGRYCSVATIDCLGSKVEHGILFKSPGHNVTTPCQLLSSGPLTLGWRGIIINGQCQFFVWDSGLRLTFLLSSSRQRSHCQAKLNFLTKEEAVVGDEPGPG